MRYLYILIMLLPVCWGSFAQTDKFPYSYKDGYRFLKNAEEKIEVGDYAKAEKLLDNAMKADYGFCGNAWYTAHDRIYKMRASIYRHRKEYDRALAMLDSVQGCQFGTDCTQREMARVQMLIDKYGKDKVREAFVGAVTRIDEKDIFDVKYIVALPAINYSFSFPFEYTRKKIDGQYVKQKPDMESVLKQQPFYALLN